MANPQQEGTLPSVRLRTQDVEAGLGILQCVCSTTNLCQAISRSTEESGGKADRAI